MIAIPFPGSHLWELRRSASPPQHDAVPITSPMTPTPAPASALFRSPRRITITLALHTYEQLQQRCDREGRSLSNLAAFLLEMALRQQHAPAEITVDRPAASPARR